jgi:hypothetical protein
VSFGVTENPTAEWISRQVIEAFPWDQAPRYLIRDRDTSYGPVIMSRFSGHFIAWAISICIGLLAGELAGAAMFYAERDGLIYSNQPSPGERNAVESAVGYRQRIHPYLGFGGPNSLQSETMPTNNLGFPQLLTYNIPFEPAPDDFVVALFGGSVASHLVTPPQGGLSIRAALQERLKGKNVIVLCLAQNSGKAPQQVMALAMLRALGQHVDLVLNLDGFNEFAVGYQNLSRGVHPVFPSFGILRGIGSGFEPVTQKIDDFYRIAYQVVQAKSSLAFRNTAADQATLGLTYFYNKVLISFFMRKRAAAEAEYAAFATDAGEVPDSKALMGVDMPLDPKADPWEELFQIWSNSSDAMAALSRTVGARYLHIIQPNQYFSSKPFAADEAKIALSWPPSEPMRVGAENGYLLLDQRSKLLAARGIVSAIHLFDQETRPMYVDGCCHYTREGETILAPFVAGQIAAMSSE